jgi:diguanylate cyclase (GGDEF)-like protein
MPPMSRDPARIITGVAASLAVLVALTLPTGYFLAALSNLDTELAGQADLLARTTSRLVAEQPRGWRYLSHLGELLRRELGTRGESDIAATLLETDGSAIARSNPSPGPPVRSAEAPVFDAGVQVAVVRVEQGTRALLGETALAAGLGLLLGAAIFVAMRVFPLRALRRTLDELHSANREAEERARELERIGRETAFLTQMTEVLQVARSVDEVGDVISRTAETLFPGKPGALYLFTESHNLLNAVAPWGGHDTAVPFAPDGCWAMRRGQPHLSQRGGLTPVCAHGAAQAGLQYCVPLSTQGEVLGILNLQCPAADAPSPEGQALATRLADQLGLALGNLKLRESLKNMSIRDALTGLFNRRYLTETLEREFARAQRSRAPVAVMMLDVDHFKRFNDSFGHDAGDAVLRELGSFLKRSIRTEDIACRYGGEEFCLVLPQMDRGAARQRAEAIRTGAAQLEIKKEDGRTLGPVTLSLGVALFPENATSMASVLAAADEALYRAKSQGRNRVVMSPAADALEANATLGAQ